MARLQANNLAKAYRGREVVRDVSLQIDSGQVVGLLGPNGAGKTTCFYMIIGIVQADRGVIELNGEDITPLSMHERARHGVGYLPQEASIFRKLTVEENILAILENRDDLDRAGREKELENLLDELHVGHVRTSLGISLSGGERRRVEIARALAATMSATFLKVVASAIVDKYIGESERNVRDALQLAEVLAPCVLWVDEIEKAISGQASAG